MDALGGQFGTVLVVQRRVAKRRDDMVQIFFGTGTGRVASMALANALNAEPDCLCLHEGKVRDFESPGEQVLPFLTLQNRTAYENPAEAPPIVAELRGNLGEIAAGRGLSHLGDVAYNNAPFIAALHDRYPSARFIFQYRDCLGFLISCTSQDTFDETPVGWPPPGKPMSKIERYIALGRLQPRQGTFEAAAWNDWSFMSRNIWLWAATNVLILDAIDHLPPTLVFRLRFESFRDDPVGEYLNLRTFLGMTHVPSQEAIRRLTEKPINFRRGADRALSLDRLEGSEREVWKRYASPVRARLGYVDDALG